MSVIVVPTCENVRSGTERSANSERPLTHLLDLPERKAMSNRTCSHPDGCPKMVSARGWCQTHYCRVLRTGSPGRVETAPVYRRSDRTCSIEGCLRKHEARGWCVMHYNRWRTHGDPQPGRAPVRGSERRATVSYSGAHMRVRVDRGSASDHLCACGSKAAHWAYDHKDPDGMRDERGCPYSANPMHYEPLCVSCHKLFDLLVLGQA